MTNPALTPTVNSAWRLDVNTGATGTPEWTQVRGCSTIAPQLDSTTQDATDYDSEGWGSDAVTLRKWKLNVTALRKIDATGVYDAGQEALRTAAEDLALVEVQYYDRSSTNGEAYTGFALVQWAPNSGDATGLQSVAITLLGQGARTAIANPTAA